MKSSIEIRDLLKGIGMTVFGTELKLKCEIENKYGAGRVFIQVIYCAKCSKTHEIKEWGGPKFYLSDNMTSDEVIKISYTAFESAVRHEVMKGFKVNGSIPFDTNVDFEELHKINYTEISRKLTAGEEVK
jgi:hypothetical protein